MWSGKSAAKTFFSRLFEKKKKKEPEYMPARKRSHSLFAPNSEALLTGNHFGGALGQRATITEGCTKEDKSAAYKESRHRLLSIVPQPPSVSREDTSDLESEENGSSPGEHSDQSFSPTNNIESGVYIGEPQIPTNGDVYIGEPQIPTNGGVYIGEPQLPTTGSDYNGEPQITSNGGVYIGEPQLPTNGGVYIGEPQLPTTGSNYNGEPKLATSGVVYIGEPQMPSPEPYRSNNDQLSPGDPLSPGDGSSVPVSPGVDVFNLQLPPPNVIYGNGGVYTGDRDSLEESFRLSLRRNTDFSQADNDLRKFLASRKSKDGSAVMSPESPTHSYQDLRRDQNHSVIHSRIYGSVEALEGEERVQRNRRFRIETASDTEECPDISPSPVLENPEYQTRWYFKYFIGKLHRNFIGQHTTKGIYMLSFLEEKSYGNSEFRAILWTPQGPKRVCFRGKNSSITLKEILGKFGWLGKVERLPREVLTPNIQKDILWLEKQEGSSSFKFGVIYAKPGQIMDDELLSNQGDSKNFNNFLDILGNRITLKGWTKYKGGLDVKGDMTGHYSYFTRFEDHEIMYHVSTLLPYSSDDPQQVERKRHIGNDIVNIVFVDGTREDMQRFKPLFIKSQFTHIYVVVCYEPSDMSYHTIVYSEKSVPLYGPSLPSNHVGFTDHQEFRRFLMVKCINGEKATYNTQVFATKRERTYQLLLLDSMEQYGLGEDSRPARERINLSEGDSLLHRKKERSRKDIFVKVGQNLKLESLGCSEHERGGTSKGSKDRETTGSRPWDPHSVHSSLQIEIIAGDSWAGVGLLVVAKEGGWILRQNGPPEKVFSLAPITQMDIMESLGIIIFRCDKNCKDSSQVYVYRLSDLETNNKILGREELREHSLEASKGCTGYTISNRKHSGLRLAITVGRKVLLYSWMHAEEWMDFTVDTIQGFKLIQELHFLDNPMVVAHMESNTAELNRLITNEADKLKTECSITQDNSLDNMNKDIRIVVGTRKGFEMVSVGTGHREQLLSLESEPSDIQELWEDEKEELLITYSCTSLFIRRGPVETNQNQHHKKEKDSTPGEHNLGKKVEVDVSAAKKETADEEIISRGWTVHREIQWNCQPKQVVPAFPYIIAFSSDTIEVRSTINCNLLQILNLPRLSLIAMKDDIYFTTTKMINTGKKSCDMEPMSKFCDPVYNIYKIPWTLLIGHNSVNKQYSQSSLDYPSKYSSLDQKQISQSNLDNNTKPYRPSSLDHNKTPYSQSSLDQNKKPYSQSSLDHNTKLYSQQNSLTSMESSSLASSAFSASSTFEY